MLASTVSFQVVVDELRQKQETEAESVQRELGKLRAQLQQTHKRLFLLEQEKQQMGTSIKGLELDNRKLRKHVTDLLEEKAALQTRTEALEIATKTLEAQPRSAEAPPPPPQPPEPRLSPSWVMLSEEEERIAELERKMQAMAEQMDALGSGLIAGAKLFRASDRGATACPSAAATRTRTAAGQTGAQARADSAQRTGSHLAAEAAQFEEEALGWEPAMGGDVEKQ
mmetsp:Transcript_44704/g.139064  ORF Transcript_44704/g.139064 Transcript_44704/m.139064 type:complete len:226 (-) Transcript_44704:13-690(-)